ncbi:class F sortase [Nocardioides sp. CBS4Y-1]|uniref:Class F sortase n=1 Tax=Nocardioides acrostichi TaxID=2784339 RepID=A0A930V3W3_9ACTN|nr:class F sortase [Nocardioides acrostichi]
MTPPAPSPSVDTTAAASVVYEPGVTRRLIVPRLGVDAPVLSIEAPGGVLTPPSDPQTIGVWAAGAQPGDATGSALVVGHTVHTGGGALDDLETMRAGDPVRFEDGGSTLAYRVSDVQVYSKGTIASDAQQLFSQSVPGRLVILTCEDWDGTGYLSNVVVTADPVG